MKILIIGPSGLPIPSVNGGAVESLITNYLKSYNQENEITIYSIKSNNINKELLSTYNRNIRFRYINTKTFSYKFGKIVFGILKRLFRRKSVANMYSRLVVKDLKKNIEESYYDLIIVENEVNTLKIYRKNLNGKIVNHIHTDLINNSVKNKKDIIYNCDEFWCVSNYISKRIKQIDNNLNTKVLHNGIDINRFSKKISEKEKDILRKKIGINKNDFVVTYVGRIFKEKGVLELIESFNSVSKLNRNAKLIIIGDKKDNSLSSKKYYRKIMSLIKCNSNIIYLGNLDNYETIKYHNITNLQVIPSLWEEAFGLVLVEALAASHQVIITKSGGMTEIVNDTTAIIINRENIIDNLTDSINSVINGDIKTNKISKKDLSYYSLESYCDRFNNLIERK